MAASDATAVPIKNQAYRVTFPIYDNDGDLVTGAAGLDSEVSKDGGTFADAASEATEIATASGVYYLDLTATEMNADTVAIQVKTSTTNAKTTVIVLYPAESADIPVNVTAVSGDTTAADNLEAALDGTGGVTLSANLNGYAELRSTGGSAGTNADELVDLIWDEVLNAAAHNVASSAGRRLREISAGIVITGTAQAGSTNTITLASGASSTNGIYDPGLVRIDSGTGAGQSRLIIDYNGTTKVAVVDRDWRVAPDATSEYTVIASPNLLSTNEGLAQAGTSTSITLNSSASSVDNTYVGQTVVIRTGTGQDQSRIISAYNGTTKVATVAQAWTTTPTSASAYMILPTGRTLVVGTESGALTASSFAANSLTASALAADAVAEIQSGLATASALATAAGYIDTEIADIQSRLPAALVGGRIDANVGAISGDDAAADALEAAFDGTTPLSVGLDATERNAIAAALLDLADGIEAGYTFRQVMRLMSAALAGEISGALTTTITIRNLPDTKARITATVDSDGNRTALVYDAT